MRASLFAVIKVSQAAFLFKLIVSVMKYEYDFVQEDQFMCKQLLLALLIFLLSPFALADTCPTVAALKKDNLVDWGVYDSDDGKPLSAERIATYKNDAVAFALAEWNGQGKEGAIHCFYHDNAGSDMEAYVAKNHVQLSSNKKYWYQVSGSTQCAAGMQECEFNTIQSAAPQLAHN